MADLLIYWRDYRRNRNAATDANRLQHWHSSAALLSRLVAGDRLWMVTSGLAAGCTPGESGFLVDLWTVRQVISNPGDDSDYPRTRYPHRIVAVQSPEAPAVPVNVDSVLRPTHSAPQLSIGRYLQGPRRIPPERLALLEQALQFDRSPKRTTKSVALVPEVDSTPRAVDHEQPIEVLNEQTRLQDGVDSHRIALGIRQPWIELILRGIKTVEVRTLETNVRGPIYLYASKVVAETPAALRAIKDHRVDVTTLPRGLLLGTAELTDCRAATARDASAACLTQELLEGKRAWVLERPQRFLEPIRPRFLPYGVWFYPFRRKGADA